MTPTRVWVCAAVLVGALLCASAVSAYRIDDDDMDSPQFEGADDVHPDELAHHEHSSAAAMKSGYLHPMRPMHPRRSFPMHPLVLSTHNLSTLLMRAFQTKNPMLLLMLTDKNTAIFYNSDLPAGGIYKGRRGLLELGEAWMKSVKMLNSTFNIVNVDEDRSTATVVRTFTGVARKTFTARTMFVIKFALQRVQCIVIIDLDYDKMVAALSSKAEKALARLGEQWFAHGLLDEHTQALVADNVSVSLDAVWPKSLLNLKGKQNIVDALRSNQQQKSEAVKLVECVKNYTDASVVLHADDKRVVTINFLGNVLKMDKYVDRHSQGTILHGITRVSEKKGRILYFELYEFDNDGKLTRMYVQLARPLMLLDRVHLRDEHNITINVEHKHNT